MRDPLLSEAETVSIRSLLPRPRVRTGIVLGLLAIGLVGGLVVGPRTISHYSGSKRELATLRVRVLAYELYPQWRHEHPKLECPKSLSELIKYGHNKSIKDPWGHPYLYTCGEHRMYVVSLGPDGKAATNDDIWSHQ